MSHESRVAMSSLGGTGFPTRRPDHGAIVAALSWPGGRLSRVVPRSRSRRGIVVGWRWGERAPSWPRRRAETVWWLFEHAGDPQWHPLDAVARDAEAGEGLPENRTRPKPAHVRRWSMRTCTWRHTPNWSGPPWPTSPPTLTLAPGQGNRPHAVSARLQPCRILARPIRSPVDRWLARPRRISVRLGQCAAAASTPLAALTAMFDTAQGALVCRTARKAVGDPVRAPSWWCCIPLP